MSTQTLIKAFGKGGSKAFKEFYNKIYLGSSEDVVYRKWFLHDGFLNFLNDVGHPPKNGIYVLDKKNANEIWKPDNCYWKVIRKYYEQKKNENSWLTKKDCVIEWTSSVNPSDLGKAGVYKITFDNGKFYIGSTSKFKSRVAVFKSSFNGTSSIHNKSILQCVLECNSVSFEILQFIPEEQQRLLAEGEFIKKEARNPLLLNRSHDPKSNIGIKWTKEERESIRCALVKKFNEGFNNKFWLYRHADLKTQYIRR